MSECVRPHGLSINGIKTALQEITYTLAMFNNKDIADTRTIMHVCRAVVSFVISRFPYGLHGTRHNALKYG